MKFVIGDSWSYNYRHFMEEYGEELEKMGCRINSCGRYAVIEIDSLEELLRLQEKIGEDIRIGNHTFGEDTLPEKFIEIQDT